jgi:hypothetical protein
MTVDASDGAATVIGELVTDYNQFKSIYFFLNICSEMQDRNIAHEFLTPVVTKNSIFWEIKWCGLLKIKRRIGGTRHLHLQDRRMSQVRNRH